MEAKKHVEERERLSRALNGQETFDGAVTAITGVLEKYNLHLTLGIAFDTFVYVLEELHLERFDTQNRHKPIGRSFGFSPADYNQIIIFNDEDQFKKIVTANPNMAVIMEAHDHTTGDGSGVFIAGIKASLQPDK